MSSGRDAQGISSEASVAEGVGSTATRVTPNTRTDGLRALSGLGATARRGGLDRALRPLRPDTVRALQRMVGNRSVARMVALSTASSQLVQRDVDSDDYKAGYQDGSTGQPNHGVPRDGDALTDYNEGYGRGQYDAAQQGGSSTSASASAAPAAAAAPPASVAPPPAAAPDQQSGSSDGGSTGTSTVQAAGVMGGALFTPSNVTPLEPPPIFDPLPPTGGPFVPGAFSPGSFVEPGAAARAAASRLGLSGASGVGDGAVTVGGGAIGEGSVATAAGTATGGSAVGAGEVAVGGAEALADVTLVEGAEVVAPELIAVGPVGWIVLGVIVVGGVIWLATRESEPQKAPGAPGGAPATDPTTPAPASAPGTDSTPVQDPGPMTPAVAPGASSTGPVQASGPLDGAREHDVFDANGEQITDIDSIEGDVLWEEKSARSASDIPEWIKENIYRKFDAYLRARARLDPFYANAAIGFRFTRPLKPDFGQAVWDAIEDIRGKHPDVQIELEMTVE